MPGSSDQNSPRDLEPRERTGLARVLPLAGRLRGYGKEDLGRDLVAGLFVAVLLVPQAMAYALLAGLPPAVGLHAAMAPAVLYALFGTSRYLSVGPVALVSLLTAEALEKAAGRGVPAPEIALTLAAMVGALLVVLGLLRFGFLVRFISEPVLTGFAAGAALLIAASQLPNLLGIDGDRGASLWRWASGLVDRLPEADPATLWLGGGALVLLVVAGRAVAPALERLGVRESLRPLLANAAPLLVVVAGAGLVAALELSVATAGEIAGGLPTLTVPSVDLPLLRALLPSAAAIALVSFVTSMAVARTLEQGAGAVEPNHELVALGAAGLAAAVTGGYPVGGSISRSAVAAGVGTKTPLASAFAAICVLATALLAGPLLAYLPKAVLAAIILTAVVGLVDVAAIRRTWRGTPLDGVARVVTFLAVLLFGVAVGIAVGAGAGIVFYLWQTSRPRVVVEGQVDDSEQFRSIDRDDVASEPDGRRVVVIRIDQDLYFANTEHFENEVLASVAARERAAYVLLDLRGVNEIDASALEALRRLDRALGKAGVDLCLAAAKRQVAERLEEDGLFAELGDERIFLTTHDAVEELGRRAAERG